ncbi:MAG: hypothetical protein COA45_07615 [Zetaproteobacteria bacterium]|nr:MAG: hypothetical protein COA45_07615 [Zetaproteobacteria bacterium]
MSGLEEYANGKFVTYVANDFELLNVMVHGYSKSLDEGFQGIRALHAGRWPPTLQEVEANTKLSDQLYDSTQTLRDCVIKIGQCLERISEGRGRIGTDQALEIAEFFSECNHFYHEAMPLLDRDVHQVVMVKNGEKMSDWYDVLEGLGLKTLLRTINEKDILDYCEKFQSIENDNWSNEYKRDVLSGIRYSIDTPVECILEA